LVTAILFTVGRSLLAFYMATAGVGSTYGAAGSLVALVVWVYYSAQIFFFGAVFTRVYAEYCGSRKNRRMANALKSEKAKAC
jgi:membrane protein